MDIKIAVEILVNEIDEDQGLSAPEADKYRDMISKVFVVFERDILVWALNEASGWPSRTARIRARIAEIDHVQNSHIHQRAR